MNDETMREAFEKWLAEEMQDDDPLKNKRGKYLDPETLFAWEAWQAAWNTRAQASAPEGEGNELILIADEMSAISCWETIQLSSEQISRWEHIIRSNANIAEKKLEVDDEVMALVIRHAALREAMKFGILSRKLIADLFTRSNAKAGEVEVIGDGCVDRITRYSDGSGFIEIAFQDVPKVESGQWLILSTHDKTKA